MLMWGRGGEGPKSFQSVLYPKKLVSKEAQNLASVAAILKQMLAIYMLEPRLSKYLTVK